MHPVQPRFPRPAGCIINYNDKFSEIFFFKGHLNHMIDLKGTVILLKKG